MHGDRQGAREAIRVELARQQVVDGHALACDGAACNAGDKAGQAAACAVRQTEDVDRCLDRAGGDVHDATEAALGHAIHRRLNHLDGGEHVGVDRLDPFLAAPAAEVAGRWTAGIGDHDVQVLARSARCCERGLAPFAGGDVGSDGNHLRALCGQGPQALTRGFDLGRCARHDEHVHALFHQSFGAAITQSLAGTRYQGPTACNSQIHGSNSFSREGKSTKYRAAHPRA